MKQIKKIMLSIILVVGVFMCQCYSVKAVEPSLNVSLSSTNTTIKKGQEVTVLVEISDIEMGDGINTFKATLNYDTDVFTSVDVQGINDWTKQTYNTENGIFILTYSNLLTTTEQAIARFTFKVKDDTTKESGTISLTEMEAANTDSKATPDDASITLNVEQDDNNGGNDDQNNQGDNNNGNNNQNNPGDNNNNGQDNQGGNNNGNSNDGQNGNTVIIGGNDDNNQGGNGNNGSSLSQGSANSPSTTSSGSLPYTGVSYWIVGVIIAVLIIGIVSYRMYKWYYKV